MYALFIVNFGCSCVTYLYLIRFHFSQMKHRVFLFHSPGYADIEVLFGPQPTPPASGQIVVVSVMHRVCHIGSTL